MLIRPAELAAIEAGTVDLAFRRWDRPRLKVGTRMRTAVGLVEVTSVDEVPLRAVTAAEARRAGASSLAALRQALAARDDRKVYRVGDVPDAAGIADLAAWLDRLDAAAPGGPWTRDTLRLIDENPAVRAPDLAAHLGRDTPSFKRDVRKLKERGLTESLDIGYRLSRRGAAVLDHPGPPRERPAPAPGRPLPKVGAPAARALAARGVTRLEDVAALTAAEVAALHGVGPHAVRVLSAALAAAGLAWADGPAAGEGVPAR